MYGKERKGKEEDGQLLGAVDTCCELLYISITIITCTFEADLRHHAHCFNWVIEGLRRSSRTSALEATQRSGGSCWWWIVVVAMVLVMVRVVS